MKRILTGLAALTVLLGLGFAASPAHAAPVSAAHLQITATYDDGTRIEQELTCYPHGGTHPRPFAACTTLTFVGGNINLITPWETACPHIYRPVTIKARGTWFGDRVHHKARYSNSCEALRATAGVYDFPL